MEEDLRGADFSSRFRRTITDTIRPSRDEAIREQDEQRLLEDLQEITKEVLAEPALLSQEWEWLLNANSWPVIRWIRVLGRLDQDRVFEPKLRELVRSSPTAITWLSLYDLAYAEATSQTDFIDNRVAQLQDLGVSSAVVFDLLFRSGYTPSRLARVIEMISQGDISPEVINQLAYHPWGSNIPPDDAHQLALTATERLDDPGRIVPFVAYYLMETKEAIPLFHSLVLEHLLTTPSTVKSVRATDDWAWGQLAELYVGAAPLDVAKATMAKLTTGVFTQDNSSAQVLRHAWEVSDKRQFFEKVIAPHIESGGSWMWRFDEAIGHFPLAELGVEYLMQWVDVDPEKRAYGLAAAVGPPMDQFSDLQAALLELYDEYGVGSVFSSEFMSGAWSGPASTWYRGKLDRASNWLTDPRPAVREWAKIVVRSIEEAIKRSEDHEAEMRFWE